MRPWSASPGDTGPSSTPRWTPRATLARSIPGTWPTPASRYTEVKLDPVCQELFRDIDKNVVDFVPNYDGTLTEPLLLPTSFPNILVSANMGIAVGMASNLCGFNLGEVCDGAIARIPPPGERPAGHHPGPGLPHRGPAALRPEGAGGHLCHRPGVLQGPGQVAVCEGGQPHRSLRDPLHHHRGGHPGQGGRAHQGRQASGKWPTCGTRPTCPA